MEEKIIWRTTPLYVCMGKTHNGCDNEKLIFCKRTFFCDKMKFSQEVGFCPKCEKYFIIGVSYANLQLFSNYKLLNSITLEIIRAKDTKAEKIEPIKKSVNYRKTYSNKKVKCCIKPKRQRRLKKKINPKWAKYNSWSLAHPYQGGGCSGK